MIKRKSRAGGNPTAADTNVPSSQEMLMCSVMIDYFNRVADLCDLTDPDRLALLDPNTNSPALTQTTIERISDLLNMWDMLITLLPERTQALTWMKRPNDLPLFGGEPPLKRLSQPGGLEATIHLLKAMVVTKSE